MPHCQPIFVAQVLFSLNQAPLRHRTGHQFQDARARAATFTASFFFRTTTEWNGLPPAITCPSEFLQLLIDHFVYC